MRGQVTAGLDNMGGTSRNMVADGNADVLGGEVNSGGHSHTLTASWPSTNWHGSAASGGQVYNGMSSTQALQPTIFLNYIIKT
jgi:hypothetical protein